MPESVSFRVSSYYRLARDEAGPTRKDSRRLSVSQALDWVLADLPGDAWSLEHDLEHEKVTITIDWAQVPEPVRSPVRPRRRR